MATYYCKCGHVLQKSINAESTGNKLDGYAPGHECFGCPYVVPITHPENGHFIPDHYECVASKELRYDTYASLFSFDRDSTAGHILSLDFDFLRQVAAECNKHEATISLNRDKNGQMFNYKSKYRPDGRFDFTIYPTYNKAGANAKRAIFEKFFTDGGARKDMTPEQEKAKILADIASGKAAAQRLEDTPMEKKQYQTNAGTIYAVRQQASGKYRIMCRHGSGDWVKATDPKLSAECNCTESLQEVLDAEAQRKGWTEYKYDPCDGCHCKGCDDTTCPQAHCDGRDHGMGCLREDGCYTPAPASNEPPEIVDESSGPEPAADGSEPTESALAANPVTSDISEQPAAFDYTGLSEKAIDIMHLAEQEIFESRQNYIVRVSNAVAMVHDELVSNCNELQGGVVANCDNSNAKHGHRGDATFTAWCAYVGISRDAAYRFLQVHRLLHGASPEELSTLESASPSLLYAAAKPSAPEELVQAVKSGDITTHKQYQELLAQLKAKDEELAAEKAAHARERESTSALLADEQHRRQESETARHAAEMRANEAEAKRRITDNERRASDERAERSEARAAEAEKSLAGARQVAKAAQMRGDKLKAENDDLRAKLQAVPATVEATVVDHDEVERLAAEKAEAVISQRTEALSAQLDNLRDENGYLRARLTRPARLAALAESVVHGCAALIQTWLVEAFEATNEEEADSIAVFNRFAYGLDMALRNGEWPSDEEIEMERAGEELEGGYV